MKTKLDGQVQETYNTAAHALDPTLARNRPSAPFAATRSFADSSPPPSSSRPRFGGMARDF